MGTMIAAFVSDVKNNRLSSADEAFIPAALEALAGTEQEKEEMRQTIEVFRRHQKEQKEYWDGVFAGKKPVKPDWMK